MRKGDVIEYTLNRLKADPEENPVIMVGDRRHDVEGAAKHGISCVGVLYGYGSQEELTKAGAGYLAADVGTGTAFTVRYLGAEQIEKSHAGSSYRMAF